MSTDGIGNGEGAKPPSPPERPELPPELEDTDSVYDDFLRKAAHAPEVDPQRLAAMSDRARQHESLVGRLIGHFRVTRELGKGGMGVVYRADDELLRRPVALKVLSPWLAASGRSPWLLNEARSAAAVSHPNIAAIHEVGEEDGIVFIAMEFVEGHSLRERVDAGPLPLSEALPIATQIARGLARAHQGGIVHRDLKPDNVMVGPDGLVKILDFGLALPLGEAGAAANDETSETLGRVVGTFAYMSPEQARGAPVDARSDVFSFGILLYELLAGQRPPHGKARSAALLLEPPGAAFAKVELRRLLGCCLAERAEERYADGAALVEALSLIPREEAPTPPVPAPLPSRPDARRWLGAVVAGAALLGAGSLLWKQPAPPSRSEVTERRLTANPAESLLLDAALAPNGEMLAYTDPAGLHLRRLNPERTETLKIPDDRHPEAVAWFPDSEELLVTTKAPSVDERRLWRLHVSSGQAVRVGAGHYEAPRISPDGITLAWLDEEGGIRVGPVVPGDSRRVVEAGDGERIICLAWSPDGKHLAYERFSQLTATLETVDVASGARKEHVRTPRLISKHGDGAVVWSGSGLIYPVVELPPSDSGFSLWRLPVDGAGEGRGEPQRLHAWTGFMPEMLSLGARGRLAYARVESQADVYVGELADQGRKLEAPRRLTLSERDEHPSGFTPDSKSVIFTSDQDGTTDVFMQALEEGQPRKLPLAGLDFKTWPVVLGSGEELLFWRYPWPANEQPHRAELMRAPLDGGSAAPVLTSRSESSWIWQASTPLRAYFRCAPTGRCVLGELEDGKLVLSAFEPRTGERHKLTEVDVPSPHAQGWALSPDGERVALPGRSGQILTIQLAAPSRPAEVRESRPGCLLRNLAWDTAGVALFATAHCPTETLSYKLLHVEPDGTTQVLWAKASTWVSRPTVSPDGKHLAFGVTPLDNDIWLVEGL